jgi:hypothetical protein
MSHSVGMGTSVALPVYQAAEPLRANDSQMKKPWPEGNRGKVGYDI